MDNEQKPIVVNMAEGQNILTLLHGDAPKRLDDKAPVKIELNGTIEAPLAFLTKRVNDIDQHKAHIIVNRDDLSITLVINESDFYNRGTVKGKVELSEIFLKLGINGSKSWQPETLSRFLKLHRCFFADYKGEGMGVVAALKQFDAKVEQAMSRERQENGNVGMAFKQQVMNSNIPERFRLKLPIFSGGEYVEIEVETFASIDGADVTISLQSAGANDVVEEYKANGIQDVLEKIKDIAPEIVIIEQ